MKETPALLTQKQVARLRHLGGIILDDITNLQGLADSPDGDLAFEHPLHGMGAK